MNPWKEAASLLLVAPNCANSNLNLLMTKRSNRSTYLATAYVFPGGHAEQADFSSSWWKVFQAAGVTKAKVSSVSTSIQGPRPPMVTQSETFKAARDQSSSDDERQLVPPDVGLRITAIRETFEETGVLLVQPNGLPHTNIDLNLWQKQVQGDAKRFVDLCLELKACPDVWSLKEWWNWLTPASLGHKRFDTIFYICCLDKKPTTNIDEKEVSQLEWYSPVDMLHDHVERRAFLAPPQVYELSRLMKFNNYESFKSFTIEREKHGVERWSPMVTGYKDGLLLSFPGDDVQKGTPTEQMHTKDMPTMEENRLKCKNLNRIELRVPTCTVYCNVKLPCGHLSPLTYPPSKQVLQSSL